MYRTQRFDVQIVSKLSQAAAHPRRGTNFTRNGISCKEWTTCYTTREEKAKKKSVFVSKIYMQEMMQGRVKRRTQMKANYDSHSSALIVD
jgi:hypothetical protein